jgi:hypothetical protein
MNRLHACAKLIMNILHACANLIMNILHHSQLIHAFSVHFLKGKWMWDIKKCCIIFFVFVRDVLLKTRLFLR